MAQNLQTNIEANMPVLKKAFSIRGNVYGHRNKSKSPEAYFAAADLTSNQMREILDLARDVVSALAESADVEAREEIAKEIRLREEYSRNDTRLIMEALEKHTF